MKPLYMFLGIVEVGLAVLEIHAVLCHQYETRPD
jgi:hypothetical protein